MNDITLRKRVEQNLNESEQRYRMLFDLSNDSNVLIDAETGKIEESNRIAHDHLGYSKEEFLQLSIAAIEAAESADEVAAHIQTIITQGSDTFKTKHKTKDGVVRDVLVKASPISMEGRQYLLSTWHDLKPHETAKTRQ